MALRGCTHLPCRWVPGTPFPSQHKRLPLDCVAVGRCHSLSCCRAPFLSRGAACANQADARILFSISVHRLLHSEQPEAGSSPGGRPQEDR